MENSKTTSEREAVVERLIARTVRFGATHPKSREAVTELTLRLARLMGMTSRRALAAAADDAVRFATDSFDGDRKATDFLGETVADLGRLAPRPAPKPPPRPVARRGDFGLTYRVVNTDDGELLMEQRQGEMATGKRKGFRITRADYAAAVAALVGAREPLKFDALHDRFVKAGGQDVPSQYPLRTVLRFWRLHDPPLVEKERARYAAVTDGFEQRAARAWRDAKPRQRPARGQAVAR